MVCCIEGSDDKLDVLGAGEGAAAVGAAAGAAEGAAAVGAAGEGAVDSAAAE